MQQRRFRSSHASFLLFLLVLQGAASPAAAQPEADSADAGAVPVVLAVDTSRSLNRATLDATAQRLRAAVADLDASTPTGLLAFDDSPRWLAGPGATPSEVAEALGELELQGNFTLLNDALFVATRELPDGGVIVLATDGRDENSAVLVDDIARRCEAQNVRILTVGTGRSIEQRALRRLALVSDGEYLGPLASGGDRLTGALASARREIAAEAAPRASGSGSLGSSASRAGASGPGASGPGASGPDASGPDASAPQASASRASSSRAAPPASGGRWWPWALLLVALALGAALLGRRSAAPAPAAAADSAEDEKHEEQIADEAEAGMIRLELAQAPIAPTREAGEVTVDTAVFKKASLEERLEHTRVMSNHGTLVVQRIGEKPRTFLLDGDKAFAVGRDALKNTLAVPDPALSAQHFKIVPRGAVFFFVDLESTNGSYINGRRCSAKRLRHLDQLRAGQVEFEFQSYSNV
ncbi:MAG: FHA domain-containing protein [Acidobacteriota bacterium]